jgi:hypothetical protein
MVENHQIILPILTKKEINKVKIIKNKLRELKTFCRNSTKN